MKKLLLILIISLSFGSISKADTIDFWHIYYNNVKVQECNDNSIYELELKIDSINRNDSISVRYFNSIQNNDCNVFLVVADINDKVIEYSQSKSNSKPKSFKLSKLITHHNLINKKEIYVYIIDTLNISQRAKIPLFIIKLQ